MRLSKQTSDAVKILAACARRHGERLKVADLALELAIPKPLALKVANVLSRLGYLETVRGPRGGIQLACDPAMTTLGAVVRDLEAFQIGGEDGEGRALSGETRGDLTSVVDNAFEAFIAVLDHHTLSDLSTVRSPGAVDADGERGHVTTASTQDETVLGGTGLSAAGLGDSGKANDQAPQRSAVAMRAKQPKASPAPHRSLGREP